MVTVLKIKDTWNRVCVRCPICGSLINRDSRHWRYHMESSHSANSATWSDTADVFGGEQGGWNDRKQSFVTYPFKCYGCQDTFSTKALLVAHLSTVHSAT